jgi:N-dimethylarginine dimethylaminohydrolase
MNKRETPDAQDSTFGTSAYGGAGWRPREDSHKHDIGTLWAACGIDSEWAQLEVVLLHCPGAELAASHDEPGAVQMFDALDLERAAAQHEAMAEAYRQAGVEVTHVAPPATPSPNQMFCADLFAMTPEGAILARPASPVRAGEERWVARRLADLGVPILKTLTGHAIFEGADLMWLDPETALIGRGLRTNDAAIAQISGVLTEIGVETVAVDMPFGTMHLMGMLRIVDRDLAIAWPRRTPHAAVTALRDRGYDVAFVDENEDVGVKAAGDDGCRKSGDAGVL